MAISLQKGQTLSLTKPDGGKLTRVRLGLGWDAVPKKGLFGRTREIDLDASAIVFDANRRVLDWVYYGQLDSRDGSLHHTGDNLTGEGEGDDEQIVVDLSRLPLEAKHIVFVITSYSKQTFNEIANVFARVVDLSGGEKELVRFDLAQQGPNTGMVMARLTSENNGWQFTAIGAPASGQTYKDVIPAAQQAL